MARCKADWVQWDEKPTRYFLNKGKSNFNCKVIEVLMINNIQIAHQTKILFEEMSFFKELYKSRKEELIPDPNYLD